MNKVLSHFTVDLRVPVRVLSCNAMDVCFSSKCVGPGFAFSPALGGACGPIDPL